MRAKQTSDDGGGCMELSFWWGWRNLLILTEALKWAIKPASSRRKEKKKSLLMVELFFHLFLLLAAAEFLPKLLFSVWCLRQLELVQQRQYSLSWLRRHWHRKERKTRLAIANTFSRYFTVCRSVFWWIFNENTLALLLLLLCAIEP